MTNPYAAGDDDSDEAAAPKARGREQWVDTAKGICMFLVVLYHAVGQFVAHGWYLGPWAAVTELFDPLRMPLFFVLSGLFARKALSGSWRSLAERRIWVMVWLLLLWPPMIEGGARFADQLSSNQVPEYRPYLEVVLEGYIYPMANLWFIAALGIFAAASKLLHRVHPAIQLALGLTLYIWSPLADFHWVWDRITTMFIFYLIGMYLGQYIRAAAKPAAFVAAVGVLGYLVVLGTVREYDLHNLLWQDHPYLLQSINFMVAICGVIAAVLAFSAVSSHPTMRVFGYIGRNTLPVYLIHDTLLRIMANLGDWVMTREQSEEWRIGILPLLAAILATAASLGIRRLFDRIGLYWFFVRPRFFTEKYWQEYQPKQHQPKQRRPSPLRRGSQDQTSQDQDPSGAASRSEQTAGQHHQRDSQPSSQR
nr:acyltransferase [Corynebacterium ulceribovis]